TGLRPEEYTGLKWPDIDFEYKDRTGKRRGRVSVRQTVIPGKPGGGWWWSDPKSESGYRDVLFPLTLLQEIIQHRAQQREHKLKMGRHYQDHDLVFATPLGTPINARMLSVRMHKEALTKAELSTDFRLYDLRHSWVTLSILAGSDIKTVSQQAGHASTAFTMDNYGHVLPEMRESALDRFEALLASSE
ncbi:MAG TPA: site-specific integrase, partial [Pyrinomonadaceae bacterium]